MQAAKGLLKETLNRRCYRVLDTGNQKDLKLNNKEENIKYERDGATNGAARAAGQWIRGCS